ncbi:cupin domain-containing protein [Halorussus salilacus]|uniref:cupin domain-containing protein n=1 Tax=Halorussus salilacus TaxID=2953750 RepID=UPI0020A18167|nr:cupin domain-containing protein [Halorussus salilacus]USZ67227.1 cupin domain-containing protein [Halorussus salilacus]
MTETVALDDLTETPREVAFPGSEPKTVRLSLGEGEAVPAHSHPERELVVYLVSGRLDVCIDGESNVLKPGELLRFDGRREVAPRAEADSTALLVLAPRSGE